jgi:hypothetical protein
MSGQEKQDPPTAGANPTSPSHGYEEAPTASSDLIWRAEIVKQLFGDVGEVITGTATTCLSLIIFTFIPFQLYFLLIQTSLVLWRATFFFMVRSALSSLISCSHLAPPSLQEECMSPIVSFVSIPIFLA